MFSFMTFELFPKKHTKKAISRKTNSKKNLATKKYLKKIYNIDKKQDNELFVLDSFSRSQIILFNFGFLMFHETFFRLCEFGLCIYFMYFCCSEDLEQKSGDF